MSKYYEKFMVGFMVDLWSVIIFVELIDKQKHELFL